MGQIDLYRLTDDQTVHQSAHPRQFRFDRNALKHHPSRLARGNSPFARLNINLDRQLLSHKMVQLATAKPHLMRVL